MMQAAIGMAMLSFTLVAAAQKPIAYPSKGQTAKQQSKDESECYAWSKQSTGIDPAALAANPPPQSSSSAGGGGRQARQNRDATNQQAQGAQQEAMNTFYRGYGACMPGRIRSASERSASERAGRPGIES